MDAELIKRSVKYLEIHLDHDHSLKMHVKNLLVKTDQRWRCIRALFHNSEEKVSIVPFKSLTIPILDYCSIICNRVQQGLIDDLENLVKNVLQSINLGELLDVSSDER